ncbi:MAG: thrombospondin type 3 repeat-containing protein [Minisyncoccia bacterium]
MLIAGAYLLSRTDKESFKFTSAQAEDTSDIIKRIAAKDTDADGLPDWEETLYGTDPTKSVSTSYGMSDAEAVAKGLLTPKINQPSATTTSAAVSIPGSAPGDDSLTDAFARTMFQQYLQTSGGKPIDAQTRNALVTELVGQFAANTDNILVSGYATSSLHISKDKTLDTYASELETIFMSYNQSLTVETANPLLLSDAYLNKGDTSALSKLENLTKVYVDIVAKLINTTVPTEFAGDHLALIRSFDLLARTTQAMAQIEHDPLVTLATLSAYKTAPQEIKRVLNAIAGQIVIQGEPAKGEPGYIILHLVRSTQGL